MATQNSGKVNKIELVKLKKNSDVEAVRKKS